MKANIGKQSETRKQVNKIGKKAIAGSAKTVKRFFREQPKKLGEFS